MPLHFFPVQNHRNKDSLIRDLVRFWRAWSDVFHHIFINGRKGGDGSGRLVKRPDTSSIKRQDILKRRPRSRHHPGKGFHPTSRYMCCREVFLDFDNYQLSVVLDSAPVGISLLSIDRTVRYCNPAFAEAYGWSAEELLGRRLPIPEHQQEHWNGLLEQLRRGERFRNVETVRVRKDGSEFYARISGTPVFDHVGNLDGLVGFVTTTDDNYSDQRELRTLEYLVQSTTDFMCVADSAMRLVFVNDSGRRMVGLGLNQDIDGATVFDVFSDDSRDRITTVAQSLASTIASLSKRLDLKNVLTGESIPVSCSVYLLRDPHTSRPISFTFVAHSLANIQQLERRAELSQLAFDSLFRAVPVAVALVNPSGYLIDSNESFQTMVGYSATELDKVPFARFVHPEDLPAGRGLFQDLIAGKIESYQTPKRLVDKEGSFVQVQMSVRLVCGPHGEPKHTISIVQRVPDEPVQSALLNPSDPTGTSRSDVCQ
jgi:PAS domain S-box-containing protein